MKLLLSPLFLVRPMVTSLANDMSSYSKVKLFVIKLMIGVVLLMMVATISGLTRYIFSHFMGVQGETLKAAITIFAVFNLYPIGLLLKDFCHAILLKFEKSFVIPFSSLLRILVVAIIVKNIDDLLFIPPAILAGLILIFAVFIEGILSLIATKASIKSIPGAFGSRQADITEQQDIEKISSRYIFAFYSPLIITSFIGALRIPLVHATLARSISPEQAITSFSIAWGVCALFLTPLSMFKQVPLLYYNKNDEQSVKSTVATTLLLGTTLTGILFFISMTPIGHYILTDLIAIDKTIADATLRIIKAGAILPFIATVRESFYGILMKEYKTRVMGSTKILNIAILTVAITFIILVEPKNTALSCMYAIVVSQFCEVILIFGIFKNICKPKKITKDKRGVRKRNTIHTTLSDQFSL
jgi:hypothetical protein